MAYVGEFLQMAWETARSDLTDWWASKRGPGDVAVDVFVCTVAAPCYLCGLAACWAGPVVLLGFASLCMIAVVILQLV